jgi:hypothetical protein
MAKLHDKGIVSEKFLSLYVPLLFLCEKWEPVGDFFDWYVGRVWGVK